MCVAFIKSKGCKAKECKAFMEQVSQRTKLVNITHVPSLSRGLRGRDRMAVAFTTTYAIRFYHH